MEGSGGGLAWRDSGSLLGCSLIRFYLKACFLKYRISTKLTPPWANKLISILLNCLISSNLDLNSASALKSPGPGNVSHWSRCNSFYYHSEHVFDINYTSCVEVSDALPLCLKGLLALKFCTLLTSSPVIELSLVSRLALASSVVLLNFIIKIILPEAVWLTISYHKNNIKMW